LSLPPQTSRKSRPEGPDDPEPVAPVGDARWHEWTRPLYELLARPRRWTRMMQWCEALGVSESMLRQMVAALEELNEAESVRHGTEMVWRRKLPRDREWAVDMVPREGHD